MKMSEDRAEDVDDSKARWLVRSYLLTVSLCYVDIGLPSVTYSFDHTEISSLVNINPLLCN